MTSQLECCIDGNLASDPQPQAPQGNTHPKEIKKKKNIVFYTNIFLWSEDLNDLGKKKTKKLVVSFIMHNRRQMQIKQTLISHSLSEEALPRQVWQRPVEA